MQTVKEGESFKCENCKKEWKIQIALNEKQQIKCGLPIPYNRNVKGEITNKEEMDRMYPHRSGCGHLNEIRMER